MTEMTDSEWSEVFKTRCRSKRGEHLTKEELLLIDRAYASDPKRYASMEADVFDATVPFGSTVRARRK
jgi:hypothetical protein